MGFYFGPFRWAKRGLRVHIALLHVGAGGTGVSTGWGPFTCYKRLRSRRRARP
jgi:hypothetical protein